MTELFSMGMQMADVERQQKRWEEEVNYHKLDILHREVDEKLEQLRSIANLSALIAGFDIVVLIELNIPEGVPEILVALFAVTSALTVCLMTLSFVTCTLMLVGLLKAFNLEQVNMPFKQFWVLKCEEDWMKSFWYFTMGVPMFIINLSLASGVKLFHYTITTIVIAVICFVSLVLWSQIHFKWGEYLRQQTEYEIELLDYVETSTDERDPESASTRSVNSIV